MAEGKRTARGSRNEHDGFTNFTGIWRDAAPVRMTSAVDLSTDMRLWTIALGSIDNYGHARFARGELVKKIQIANEETGEISPISRQNLNKALAKLKAAGMVQDNSCLECIVIPRTLAAFKHAPNWLPGHGCKVHSSSTSSPTG